MWRIIGYIFSFQSLSNPFAPYSHRFDELRGCVRTMKNHMKIKDMANVLTGEYSHFSKNYTTY